MRLKVPGVVSLSRANVPTLLQSGQFLAYTLRVNLGFSASRPSGPEVGKNRRSKDVVFRIRQVGVIMVRLPVEVVPESTACAPRFQ